ncbi:hypothetical protein [Geminicoccus harenae]|uniref:hypothetical protein n=2 Tax=Geminicoccus harenae TaxID=2498453 RepID=UPI001C941E99|nr:hypothetical protein [Geminicoccus harenae]
MNPFMSDMELLGLAARRLGMEPEMLMQRYYGSILDAEHEFEEFCRSGRLQDSFRAMLRARLNAMPGEAQESGDAGMVTVPA